MIHDEGRLDQVLLNKCLEEQVQDIASLVALLKLYMMLLCNSASLFQCVDLIEINTGLLLNCLYHGQACERLAQIHLNAVVCDGGGTKNSLCHMAVQVLGQIHHAVIIGICLV